MPVSLTIAITNISAIALAVALTLPLVIHAAKLDQKPWAAKILLVCNDYVALVKAIRSPKDGDK